ncbi:MAG: hypothetical protein IKO42_05430 [Opitutales bacterium]|nr:hypothetical protein [Opitutales bacterium]
MDADKIIDELLAKKPVKAGENFTQSLFEKIEREKFLDAQIDGMLKSAPIEASEGFAQKVAGKIRAIRRRRIFGYAGSISAVAACAALTFTVFLNKPDAVMQIACEFQEIENATLALSEYEDHFNAFNPNFCDYDLNLYAIQ